MNFNKMPRPRIPRLSPWLIVSGLILLAAAFLCLRSDGDQTQPKEATLPDIVGAIEAGEVETLTVRGDLLVAAKTDGSQLSAQKESNISTIEALQLLGASPDALKTLPIVVTEPAGGPGSLLGMLLTLAPLLLIGYLLFRFTRQMQGGGGMFNSSGPMGRSQPRVIGGGAEEKERIQRPAVTFEDVAGAEQAKLELQEVVEFLKEAHKFIKLGARIP